ncbi:hypothetical protein BDV97DRAFT_355938 [Delphinella strobiligena]|nr:hypothetical protein BDV97DRAFT_355938 [Delphinella strobiligena]
MDCINVRRAGVISPLIFLENMICKQPSRTQQAASLPRLCSQASWVSDFKPFSTFHLNAAPPISPSLHSAIVTISVGPSQRLFAAHEEVLTQSPYFAELLRKQYFMHPPNSPTYAGSNAKRIGLPDQEAEVFSSVLEYLYKGDYYPRLEYDRRRNTYLLEDGGSTGTTAATIWHSGIEDNVLKDAVIYCTADLYDIPPLKRLALTKQGLCTNLTCATLLTSARFAYAHTPDTESRLRAHYLALIIRSRDVFKRSGTLQAEMERGGRLWFDLFVALVNHLDDVAGVGSPR